MLGFAPISARPISGGRIPLTVVPVVTTRRGDDGGRNYLVRNRKDIRQYLLGLQGDIPTSTSNRAKRAIARQVIVAAGESDLLPELAQFKDEIIQIGSIALGVMKTQSLADVQAAYREIVAILDAIEAQRRADDEDDEAALEMMLLAA